MKANDKKQKNLGEVFRIFGKIYQESKPWRKWLIIAFILAILGVILRLFGPMLLGKITTSVVESVSAGKGIIWHEVNSLLVLLAIISIFSALFSYVQSVIMTKVSVRLTKRLRMKILDKIATLPMAYFDRVKIGDVMSRMSNDVDEMASEFSYALSMNLSAIVRLAGVLIMMLLMSPILTVVTLIIMSISMIIVKATAEKAQKLVRMERKLVGSLNSKIEESYTGLLLIKANSREKKTIEEFNKTNEELAKTVYGRSLFSSLALPIVDIFTAINFIAVCILGGMSVISGKMAIGEMQAFIQYSEHFRNPITMLANMFSTIQRIAAAAERVFDFLAEEEEVNEDNNRNIEQKQIKGEVEFRNVCFSYDDKPIIKNFSCKINAGMKVAIVGPTGAGKTTIINLLTRFYEPNSGYITIDNIPIKDIKREQVRKMFGMVLQDTWLFSGTIYDNLKYGVVEDISEKTVTKILEKIGILHIVSALPNGIKTKISEDSDNISAGEKQLLTIARAIIADPPMIILDEATSNVDTRAEQLIQDAFAKLTTGKTSFIIAHRLSTIREADLILVMKDGNIVEQGKHDELIAMNGNYAELYNSQFTEE